MTAIYVEIIATKGSAPRDAGTAMRVTATGFDGTIGGGALERQAIKTARHMLTSGARVQTQTIPLGPGLGQCCGGAVTLRYSDTPKPVDDPLPLEPLSAATCAAKHPLWVWGAGHVGRAVIRRGSATKAFDLTWVDDHAHRFPADVAPGVRTVVATDMPLLARSAPKDVSHLILTYSHDIDLALCAALLQRGFAFCGLIGSDTKWARFSKRLAQAGLDPSAITCPIGDKSRGKHPDAIAHGTLAGLLRCHAKTETV